MPTLITPELQQQLLDKHGCWKAVEDQLRIIRLQNFLHEISKPEPVREKRIWIRNQRKMIV